MATDNDLLRAQTELITARTEAARIVADNQATLDQLQVDLATATANILSLTNALAVATAPQPVTPTP